jgi:hypothetical protein
VVDAVAVLGRFLDALLSYHFRDFLDFGFSHIQRQIRKCKFRLIIALLRTFWSGSKFIVARLRVIVWNIGVSAPVVSLCLLACVLLSNLLEKDILIVQEAKLMLELRLQAVRWKVAFALPMWLFLLKVWNALIWLVRFLRIDLQIMIAVIIKLVDWLEEASKVVPQAWLLAECLLRGLLVVQVAQRVVAVHLL